MNFRSKVLGTVLGGAIALMAASPVMAASIDARDMLKTFNSVVLNSFTVQSGGHVHGRTFVGNDLTSVGDLNLDQVENTTLNGLSGTLFVGDDILVPANQSKLLKGNAQVGDNVSGNFQTNNGTLSSGVSGIPVTEVLQAFESLSQELAGFASTGGTAHLSDNNDLRFTSAAGADNVAVFNLTAAEFNSTFGNGNPATYKGVTATAGVTTIINVAGTNLTYNANGAGAINPSVIFNFYEAETLFIGNNLSTSVLAPFANMSITKDLKGTVVAEDLTLSAQIVGPLYDGNIPPTTVVPVPAAAYLLLTGIAAIGGMAARRRKA